MTPPAIELREHATRVTTLLDDPYNRPGDHEMEFRLTYDGPLLSTQREPIDSQKDHKADHKHIMRKRFHKQLKRLWEITPFLHNHSSARAQIRTRYSDGEKTHDIQTLSEDYS